MKIHRDWWTWVAGQFKLLPEKVGGDYHAEHLPQTERLLPYLRLQAEVRMPQPRVCTITGMTGSVVTKWFRYMTRLGIISYRNCGKSGVGLTLLKDLSTSPYASRQGAVSHDADGDHHDQAAFLSVSRTERVLDTVNNDESDDDEPDESDDALFLDLDKNLKALGAAATLAARSHDMLQGMEYSEGDIAPRILAARECIETVKRQITLIRTAVAMGENEHLDEAIRLGGTD